MPSLSSSLLSAALANGARAATGHYGYQRVTVRVYEPTDAVEIATPSIAHAASLYAVARRADLTLDNDCI